MLRTPFTWLARLPKVCFTRDTAPLIALLAIAIAIRLPLMTFPGYWHDLASYVTWGNELVTHGFSNLYAVRASDSSIPGIITPSGETYFSVNYPPGTPYLFGGVVLLYNFTLAPIMHAPLTAIVSQNGLGPLFAKLVLLVADLATTVLLYREARKRHSQRFALLAAASFAFSPAVLYDGVVWGQTDALVMLPVLLAVFAVLSKRYSLGGVSLALAVLIKLQSVIFIPLVVLYLWRWARREDCIRFAVALAGTALLLLLPVMVPRFQLFDMLANMRAMSFNNTFTITRDAFNFWWLIGFYNQSMGSSLLGVKFAFVADALFGAVTLVIGWVIWRHREPAYLCLGLAIEASGFFMFMSGQLERYLFPFIPLMLAALIFSERKASNRLLILYVSGTVLCTLNMMATIGAFLAGVSPMIPYMTFQSLNDFTFNYFAKFAFAISAYLVSAFAYAMYIYLGGKFTPLALDAPPHDLPSVRKSAPASHPSVIG